MGIYTLQFIRTLRSPKLVPTFWANVMLDTIIIIIKNVLKSEHDMWLRTKRRLVIVPQFCSDINTIIIRSIFYASFWLARKDQQLVRHMLFIYSQNKYQLWYDRELSFGLSLISSRIYFNSLTSEKDLEDGNVFISI